MKKRAGAAALLRFAAPSLLGIAVFLVPFTLHGGPNTLLGHLKETLLALFAGREPELAAAVSTAAAVLALAAKFFRPAWIVRDEILHENLTGGPVWFAARVLAMPVALCVWLGAGHAAELGGFAAAFVKEASFIVCGMTPRLVALAVVLGLLSPLVMDFGLVQFIAVYASPVMRPLFRVPGRSAVDCVASWLGSSSMAVVFTAKMYDSGYYTGREAAAVVCGFSLAGIYNIYAVAELMNVGYALPQILLISYSSMILLAALLPRLAPLSSIPDEYISGRSRYAARAEGRRRGMPVLRWALFRGTAQARRFADFQHGAADDNLRDASAARRGSDAGGEAHRRALLGALFPARLAGMGNRRRVRGFRLRRPVSRRRRGPRTSHRSGARLLRRRADKPHGGRPARLAFEHSAEALADGGGLRYEDSAFGPYRDSRGAAAFPVAARARLF